MTLASTLLPKYITYPKRRFHCTFYRLKNILKLFIQHDLITITNTTHTSEIIYNFLLPLFREKRRYFFGFVYMLKIARKLFNLSTLIFWEKAMSCLVLFLTFFKTQIWTKQDLT